MNNEQWAAGVVQCDLCGHDWVAVRPADIEHLECPNCGNFVYFEEIEIENDLQL